MSVYSRVVVGTDGSVTAQRAVRRAATIAAGLGAPLLVATAWSRSRPEELGPLSERAQAQGIEAAYGFGYMGAQETAQDGVGVARAVARDLPVDTATPEGDPADTLLGLAEADPGSLLVVGGQGLGASGVFLLGNVPHKVAHHAVSDTLIVRTSQARTDGAPASVLIGFDGSKTAALALDQGVAVARTLGASVTVLAVGRPDWAADVLEQAVDHIGAVQVAVHTEHHDGDAATVLVEMAGRHGLLVLGNKGMTGVRRFLLGSVPNKVSQHVAADLLIVKTT